MFFNVHRTPFLIIIQNQKLKMKVAPEDHENHRLQYFRVRLNNCRRERKLAMRSKSVPFLILWPKKILPMSATVEINVNLRIEACKKHTMG